MNYMGQGFTTDAPPSLWDKIEERKARRDRDRADRSTEDRDADADGA